MDLGIESRKIGRAAKVGAAMFVLWSVLHIWVGFEGLQQYMTGETRAQWNMVIGGAKAPLQAFQHTMDPVTAHAQSQLLINFCIDVGGYGVLGLFVAWIFIRVELDGHLSISLFKLVSGCLFVDFKDLVVIAFSHGWVMPSSELVTEGA